MNFNPREKVLIALLAVIATGALYVNLFLLPQLKYITKTKEEIEQFKITKIENEKIKKAVNGIDSELKILTQRFKDLRAVFPPKINQEELLLVLQEISEESDLGIESITFSEIVEVRKDEGDPKKQSNGSVQNQKEAASSEGSDLKLEITNSKLKDTMKNLGLDIEAKPLNEKEIKKNKIIPDGKSYSMDAKLSVKGSNDQIKDFLLKVEELKNKTSVKELTINKEDSGILSANITLQFFGIMDRKAGEYKMLADGKWEPHATGEKNNIFKTYEGYKGPVNVPQTKNQKSEDSQLSFREALKELQKYDITMGILPFGDGMAPPTITIAGKHVISGDQSSAIPVIYGDNKGEEKVEISFEQKDGKILSRFRTQSDSFPSKSSNEEAELKASGESIMILIDSINRKGQNDKAGADITISNKTKKKVIIDVRYDDKNQPRVRINKAAGDITVNYK